MSILTRIRSRTSFPVSGALACLALAAVAGLTLLAWPSRHITPEGGAGAATNAAQRLPRAPAVRRPFFRAVYGGYGGTRLRPAREGARYRVMILHHYDRRRLRQLKAANPRLKLLMYVDMMSSDPRDPAGTLDWASYTDATAHHPNWFLRDRNGKPLVFKDYPTSRVMDVGNPLYQDAGAARVIRLAKSDGFDGVFLDDANASLRWVIAGGSAACATYPTTAKWQSAAYSFLANVGPQLHGAGLLAVANIGGSTITSGLWKKWNGPIDGAMEESFTNGGTGPDSMANGQWPAKLSHALWSEENGKISLDHAVTGTRRGARYALATMLLVAGGENLFSASLGYSREVWWPEYHTANSLGRPLGAYRVLRNGVFRRDFTNGVVLVNPSVRRASSVRLGGRYSGSGLRRVGAVSLARTSGVVLAR
jgi:putative glycosyl hydrolase-like family 15 (GHL15) protein